MDKLNKELAKHTAKLANPNFIDKAPAKIVAKEQLLVTEMTVSLQQLETQMERIRTI